MERGPETEFPSFLKDKRSGLAKLLGNGAVPTRSFEDFEGCGGRFKGTSLAFRALSASEVALATSRAVAWLTTTCGFQREDLYTEVASGFFSLEVKVQCLALALVEPADPAKPWAETPAQLRELLEPDEITALFERWQDWQEERSPLSGLRSVEAVDEELDALGKGLTAATSLLRYDSGTLRFMLRRAAERLRAATRPSSSGTSPTSADSSQC